MPMPHLTVEDYLEGEKTSSVRHEYVAGHLFARDGISARHNGIALNLATRLHSHLRGSQCRVFMSAVKARIEALDFFYYPDVMVSCDSEDRDEYFSNRPCLIVEVIPRVPKQLTAARSCMPIKRSTVCVSMCCSHRTKSRLTFIVATTMGSGGSRR